MEIQPGIDIYLGDCLDRIICGDNVDVLKTFPDSCIDLTVTSPPYDNLRKYNGYTFDFEGVAAQLLRVTKPGGVVVWVVGDETKDFCESLTSFKQAIHFTDVNGFNLLDTMIYYKQNYPAAYPTLRRYASQFEYMFVLVKGKPKTFSPVQHQKVRDKKESRAFRQVDGSLRRKETRPTGRLTKDASNVWKYPVGGNETGHPAPFPEALARDHILSWSNEGDVVLDPFIGSGTTAKMAVLDRRHFVGIDTSEEYCDIARRRVAEAYVAVGNIEAAQAARPIPKKIAAGAEQTRLF